jgi:hypothetical protein
VKETWQSIRRVTIAPTYIAVALGWLAVILWVVIGKVIVRETTVGGALAQQIERLPPFVARPVFTTLWFVFFLGWIVPLAFGIKRLFRRAGNSASTNRNGAELDAARR